MIHNLYLFGSSFLFFILSFVWTKSNIGNMAIKISFFIVAMFGLLLGLTAVGYVIKV